MDHRPRPDVLTSVAVGWSALAMPHELRAAAERNEARGRRGAARAALHCDEPRWQQRPGSKTAEDLVRTSGAA